jgi:DNA mismatch endonuclease (patch repair protein)
MPDIYTVAQRSKAMARIRGRGNKSTEAALARLFRKHKLAGWRRHTAIAGRPDFAFRRSKVAVFVDGCFWHGCPEHYKAPATRVDFWSAKIAGNIRRDIRVARHLRLKGWVVLRIWEHSLRSSGGERVIKRVKKAMERASSSLHPSIQRSAKGYPMSGGRLSASEDPDLCRKPQS